MQARVNNMIKSKGVFITNIFGETQRLGEEFAKDIVKRHPPGVVLIALHGELGSGKTTFVQGIARGLRIKRRIISPTFVIVRRYKLKSQMSKLKSTSQIFKLFYHIDLYRVENAKQIETLGIGEILKDPKNIVAIEWAEKMGKLLPKKRWDIEFEYLEEDKRKIFVVSS